MTHSNACSPLLLEPTRWLRVRFLGTAQDIINFMTDKQPDDPKKTRLFRQIDENLKRFYAALRNEPVPGRLKQLLARLRDKEDGK